MGRKRPLSFLVIFLGMGGWVSGLASVSVSVCDLCKNPLGTTFFVEEGTQKRICETCAQSSPSCIGCGSLLGSEAISVRGSFFCPKCFHSRKRCGDCGLPILLRYYHVAGKEEEVFCDVCFANHPHCRFCGRPHIASHFSPDRPVSVCDRCYSSSVRDPEEVRKIYLKVSEWMEKDLGVAPPPGLTYQLVPALWEQSAGPQHNSYRELGAYIQQGRVQRIEILEGLPRPLLYETIAHELAHAWQADQAVPDQRLLIKEGFAQWVAAKALAEFRFPDALLSLKGRTDLYGEGYRLFEKVEKKYGRQAVLNYALETR